MSQGARLVYGSKGKPRLPRGAKPVPIPKSPPGSQPMGKVTG